MLANPEPLSFQEVIESVNKIRDYLADRVKLTTADDGLVHIRGHGHGRTSEPFDMMLKATETKSVRGFVASRSYLLAKEAGVPAVIMATFSVPIHGSLTAHTHLEYLMVNRGDDPVLLFLNVVRGFLGDRSLKLSDVATTSLNNLLPPASAS